MQRIKKIILFVLIAIVSIFIEIYFNFDFLLGI